MRLNSENVTRVPGTNVFVATCPLGRIVEVGLVLPDGPATLAGPAGPRGSRGRS